MTCLYKIYSLRISGFSVERDMEPKTVESGVQFFSRLSKKTNSLDGLNPKLFPDGGPYPNHVIEVEGDLSNDLLLDFLVRCILPKDLKTESWRGSGAILINCDFHISILRITKVLDAHLKHLKIENRKSFVQKASNNLTILNCYNSEQIEITFLNLDRIVQEKENISLLVVDSIVSQFWEARQRSTFLSLDYHAKTILNLLRTAVKNLNLTLIFSRSYRNKATKGLDLQVDYKIIYEKINGENRFVVINYGQKTKITVPFNLHTFISYK